MRIVSFDRFLSILTQEFEFSPGLLTEDTNFVRDLDFDSLELFRLSIVIEMLAPIDLPEHIEFDELTVGLVYRHYAAQAAMVPQ